MKRIVFTPGVGQIVNAAAALTQERALRREPGECEDILVFFGSGRYMAFARAMEEAARCVWNWGRMVWAEDILVNHFPTRRFAPLAGDMLRDRLGSSVDEVWVSKLGMEATKLALHAYPESRVVLFEDGAEEYIEQEILCGRSRLFGLPPANWPGALRREWSHWTQAPECLDMVGVCARQRARVVARYSFLTGLLEPPGYLSPLPVVSVEKETLAGRLSALAPMLDAALSRQSDRRPEEADVLFLPQPFADMALDEEDEYALYRSCVSAILAKGYTILWKEHPREITPMAARLQGEFGDERLRVLPARQQVPVECQVAGWNLAAVVSVASTSLFYLKGLYGLPAYTAAACIGLDRWKTTIDRQLAELFIRSLPGLDRLPHA